MMEAILLDSGYSVKAFTRSFDAAEGFRAVIGTWLSPDIKMPGMDGLEVLQRIKERMRHSRSSWLPPTPPVEMSIQALRCGAYDMLTKPFEPEELLYRVKNALTQTELLEETVTEGGTGRQVHLRKDHRRVRWAQAGTGAGGEVAIRDNLGADHRRIGEPARS